MKLIKKTSALIATSSLYLATAYQVFAQAPSGANIVPDKSALVDVDANKITIELVVKYVVMVLVALGIIAALIWLIIGAIKWILSGGDKEKVAAARGQIIAAIIGLVVLLLAVVILSVVIRILGVGTDIFNIYVPSVKEWIDTQGNGAGSL